MKALQLITTPMDARVLTEAEAHVSHKGNIDVTGQCTHESVHMRVKLVLRQRLDWRWELNF